MFAISFDLDLADTLARHPVSVRQAYRDIERALARYDFRRIQQSVYLTDQEDMTNTFAAIHALKSMPWFPHCVKDVRAFRVENWSDFTSFMKSNR